MAQISSFGALPDPSALFSGGVTEPNRAEHGTESNNVFVAFPTGTGETQASPVQSQLTRLSAVLNGLQSHASTTRTQYIQMLSKVKSGIYQINPADVSRSIISDLLSDNR